MKWWRAILRNPTGLAGAVIVLTVAMLSLSAPLLPLADPAETNLAQRLQSPGVAGHWLGTDLLGRDILSRMVWGTRLSLGVAAVATLFAAGVGSVIGLVAGYFGRRIDGVLMRGIDMVMAFPYLLLALAIVAVLGPGLFNALIAIAVVNIPFFARTVRGTTVGLVKRDFVDTARMSGRSELGILFGEVLPNVVPVIIITMATTLGWMILETAGLSFLGLGAQPPKADLGSMLGEGRKLLLIKPHLALLPGAVVFVLVMGINLLGDALRDALDPRLSSGVVGRASGVTRVAQTSSKQKVDAAEDRPDSEPLIEVKDLTVKIQLASDELVAARDICFSLKRGETLGLVGESGSGKSVTALALMRLLPSPPARIRGGGVRFDGRELLSASPAELRRLRGNRVAYVFQDPLTSLNPMFTAGEQIAEVIRLHRDCTRREAWEDAVQLLDSLKIPDARKRAESYPHELSGGMRQRVGLAMALANRPDLLIADEPTTALDVTVQRVVIDLLREQIRDSGTALLFISHDLALVSEVCERVMVMKDGEIVESGRTREVLSRPKRDYTRKLLDALPSADRAPEPLDDEGSKLLFELQGVSREFASSGGGWFSGSRETVRALEDVSFAVPKGSTFGVVGESGCGKTTLARILCGLLPASSGEAVFQGEAIERWMTRSREFRSKVQIVFQDPASSLNPRLRVRSILRQPLRMLAGVHDVGEQEAEMKKLLEQTGLIADALDRFPHEFSGGQAQRIGIARALAARPSVLVLDEAVSSLDVSVQAQILDLLRGLRGEGGLTIVFVSHDLAVIRELCTHVAVLSGGRFVECGRAADIFDSPKQEYTRKLLASRVKLARGW